MTKKRTKPKKIAPAEPGNLLKEAMAAAGMKGPQLADLAGTTRQQIKRLRDGERGLSRQRFHRSGDIGADIGPDRFAVDDASRHGTDVGSSVPADVAFVAHASARGGRPR